MARGYRRKSRGGCSMAAAPPTALGLQHRPCCLPLRRGTPPPPPSHSPLTAASPAAANSPMLIAVDTAWTVCPGRRPMASERQQEASASSPAACTEGPWHPARIGPPAGVLRGSR